MLQEQYFTKLEEIYPELIKFRRDLHMYPELSHKEIHTPAKIADYLSSIGLKAKQVWAAVGWLDC
ncbi:metal-dependent amidase/aminoacylase/carboxypeptidase family protein [Bacillus thermophilus]|uniref:Metal-dependent amidase/aminoacylase/carboxypeptidase family protein n=1 Tax=Siminovitchia thermophila TaxID=1245522 RepID=A0ABS2R718_9BACI|nr:metal-dependent amidase/aminoacylase/carboxypeptidase family protein [Siminovitchia thermophila]